MPFGLVLQAVIVKNYDDGDKNSDRSYGHALVVGLAKEPRKVWAPPRRSRQTSTCAHKPAVSPGLACCGTQHMHLNWSNFLRAGDQ